jgi:hypothetical protein
MLATRTSAAPTNSTVLSVKASSVPEAGCGACAVSANVAAWCGGLVRRSSLTGKQLSSDLNVLDELVGLGTGTESLLGQQRHHLVVPGLAGARGEVDVDAANVAGRSVREANFRHPAADQDGVVPEWCKQQADLLQQLP